MDDLIGELRHLLRVRKIFQRYCREGNRPTRTEAEDWLRSEGWQPAPLAVLLQEWGYTDPETQ